MTSHSSSEDQKKPSSRSLLDTCFSGLEATTYRYPVLIVLVAMGLAALCLMYTAQNLKFKTSRQDLIAQELPFHVLYQKYRQLFEDYDGMIVVVEGDRPEAMKGFTEALAQRLNARREIFSQIYYKIDTRYFKNKSLLYLDSKELDELEHSLRSHEDFLDRVNASPGLNTLLAAINREISAGMVDSLMTDFLGEDEEEEEDDTQDLSLLITLLRQINDHLKEERPVFRSPWGSLVKQEENPLESEGYLVSDDGRMLFVLLNPRETQGDFTGSKKAIEVIRGMIRETQPRFPEVKVGLTGGEVISSDEMFTTMEDAQNASRYALMGVALLFILFYRGVVKPILAVFTLMVSIAWAMGYTTLVVGHLNIISVVFTTILIGLGIDFGIHILCRYREERRLGHEVQSAMRITLLQTGRGNLAGALTTAIAFGTLALTDFIGIIELGMIAAGGVLLCLVGMVSLLPALVTLEERWRKPIYVLPARVLARENFFEKIFAHSNKIILICLGLLLAAAGVSKDLTFDYNLLHMQAKGTEAVTYEMKIIESAKRASWNAAIIADSLEEARTTYQAVRNMPSVGRVESILSAIPEQQVEKIRRISRFAPLIDAYEVAPENEIFSISGLKAILKKIRFKLRKKEKEGERDDVFAASEAARELQETLRETDPVKAENRLAGYSEKLFSDYRSRIEDLKRAAHPTPVQLEALPEDLKKRFVSKEGHYLLLIYPEINIWEREAMEQFLDEMRRIDPEVTGNAVHMFESSRLMIEGYIRGGLYALGAIFIYIWITLRNLRTTWLVLLPTLAGAVYTLGLMDLFQIQFNLANLVILPLILGIGVVDGVHIVHRYREEGAAGGNVISKSTGQAVTLTSLTTMIGFGSLMIADHQGVHSLGAVLTLGVGSCLFTSVTLLPALMKLCYTRGWEI